MTSALRKYQIPLWITATALGFACLIAVTPERLLIDSGPLRGQNPHYDGLRLIRDNWDVDIYYKRAAYAVTPGARPYVDVHSEYPQLATYAFAIPRLVGRDRNQYAFLFRALMALVLGLTAVVVVRLCRRFGLPVQRAWLLLLPATLYFTLNRFDILAAFLSILALERLLHNSIVASYAALGTAVLTKVYPGVYFPIFAVWTAQQSGRKALLKGCASFAATIALFSAQLAFWASPQAILQPTRFQFSRGSNNESLYYLATQVSDVFRKAGGRLVFLGLQVAPLLILFFRRPRTGQELLRLAAATTVSMVVFARFHSPQWIVWIVPLACVAYQGTAELGLLIVNDVLTYLYFPIAYDAFGYYGRLQWEVAILSTLVLFALIAGRLILLGRFVAGASRAS